MSTQVMLRRSLQVTAAALAVIGMTACSPTDAGSTEPETRAPTPSKSPGTEVKIKTPKNLIAVSDTCTLLTPEQLAELGMQAKPERSQSRFGTQRCDWSGDEFAMTITPDTTTGGIDALFRDRPSAHRSTVSGYPAAWLNQQSILCRVEVGVAKNAKFAVSYTSNATSDEAAQVKPCEQGEKVAAMVLTNIPDA